MHLKFSEPAPFELIRWHIAETFGWTLEYIDGLSIADMHEYFQVAEGKSKAMPQAKPRGKRSR